METKKKTNRHKKAYLAGLALCIVLFVFQGVFAATNAVNKGKEPEKEPKAKTEDASQKKEPEKEENSKYAYSPIGKPDPFKSFLKKSGFGGRRSSSLSGKEPESMLSAISSLESPKCRINN